MRTKLASLIALLLALASGALAWQYRQTTVALTKQAIFLREEVTKKNEAFREQGALLERLQEENGVYGRELASLREKASVHAPASTADQDQENNSQSAAAKMFSKITKDPKLMAVTRQWQLTEIKKVYGDFVRARHLNPQQAKQFFDLLLKEDARSEEQGAKLLSGDEKETAAAELSSAAGKADIERQLRLLLGDNVYAEYQEYKTSANVRATLLKIQEHFARTSVPLRNDQAKTLLQIMLEEHDLNQTVLDRMETTLSPEQAGELQRFREESREMQRLRIDAAWEMMDRKNKNDTPAPMPSP